MPIRLLWDNAEKTILRQNFINSFTLDDWYHAATKTCIMLGDFAYPVNMILDLTALDQLPCAWINLINNYEFCYRSATEQQIIIVRDCHIKPMRVLLNAEGTSRNIQVVSSYAAAKELIKNTSTIAAAV